MILSVSRRCDIPNYYAEWFYRRLEEGFFYVRNPRNPRQVSRVPITPETVDGIVFWTKNPAGMMARLEELRQYPYYFQFTLTGYGREIEPGLPDKRSVLIPAFWQLARKIGAERVIWRYDPIFLSGRYSMEYHRKAFGEIAEKLQGYTQKVIISFVDFYEKIEENRIRFGMRVPDWKEMRTMAAGMVQAAEKCGMSVASCAEETELADLGVAHGACVDAALLERLSGASLRLPRDRYQRPACGCAESVDMGLYDSCPSGCRYCYANRSAQAVRKTAARYDAAAPILCGKIFPEDRIVERQDRSRARQRDAGEAEQISLFSFLQE